MLSILKEKENHRFQIATIKERSPKFYFSNKDIYFSMHIYHVSFMDQSYWEAKSKVLNLLPKSVTYMHWIYFYSLIIYKVGFVSKYWIGIIFLKVFTLKYSPRFEWFPRGGLKTQASINGTNVSQSALEILKLQ